jgi:hypothetical protein
MLTYAIIRIIKYPPAMWVGGEVEHGSVNTNQKSGQQHPGWLVYVICLGIGIRIKAIVIGYS